MPIKIGSDFISDSYLGDDRVQSIYIGNEELYSVSDPRNEYADGVARFLGMTNYVTDSSSAIVDIAYEPFDPSLGSVAPVVEHVGTGNLYTAVRTSARDYPSVDPEVTVTNAVPPWRVTIPLDLGENIIRVQTGDPDLPRAVGVSATVGILYDTKRIYRKSSLSSETVSTKAELMSAIRSSLNASVDSGTDIITIDTNISFDFGEWESSVIAAGGAGTMTRTYLVTIVPDAGISATMKMNYHEILESNGRSSSIAQPFSNYGYEYLRFGNLHFKGWTFGQSDQPMSGHSLYTSSNSGLINGIPDTLVFEDCEFVSKYTMANDVNLDLPPQDEDEIADVSRNRFPTYARMDYPSPQWRAPSPASYIGSSVSSGQVVGSVTSWDLTSDAFVNGDGAVPWIKRVEVEDLGSSSYELRLVFYYENEASIFGSIARWFDQNTGYSGRNLLRFKSDGNFVGWTNQLTAGWSGFEAEVQGAIPTGNGFAETTISLRGDITNSIGAELSGWTGSLGYEIRKKSGAAATRFLTSRTIDRNTRGSIEDHRFIGCTFTAQTHQGGIATAKLFEDCLFIDLRGDAGHNTESMFNCSFAGGDEIAIQDFYDATHSDVAQFFDLQSFTGKIFQNLYFTENGAGNPNRTIYLQMSSRTNTIEEDQYHNIIVDNWLADESVYTVNADGSRDAFPVAGSDMSGLCRNLRISNFTAKTSDLGQRWDLGPERENLVYMSGSLSSFSSPTWSITIGTSYDYWSDIYELFDTSSIHLTVDAFGCALICGQNGLFTFDFATYFPNLEIKATVSGVTLTFQYESTTGSTSYLFRLVSQSTPSPDFNDVSTLVALITGAAVTIAVQNGSTPTRFDARSSFPTYLKNVSVYRFSSTQLYGSKDISSTPYTFGNDRLLSSVGDPTEISPELSDVDFVGSERVEGIVYSNIVVAPAPTE